LAASTALGNTIELYRTSVVAPCHRDGWSRMPRQRMIISVEAVTFDWIDLIRLSCSAHLVWGSLCQALSPPCERSLLDEIGTGLAALWAAPGRSTLYPVGPRRSP